MLCQKPFGIEGRYGCPEKYRYGFNGKENDNEVKGTANQQDYDMRIYDPRAGRFLSVDPLTKKYPALSTYQFAGNSPIEFIDRDGEEPWKRKELQTLAKMNEGIVSTSISVSAAAGISTARGHGMAVDQSGNVFYFKSKAGLAANLASMQTNVSTGVSLGYSFYKGSVDLTDLTGYGQSMSIGAGPNAVGAGYGMELQKGQKIGSTFSFSAKCPSRALCKSEENAGISLTYLPSLHSLLRRLCEEAALNNLFRKSLCGE